MAKAPHPSSPVQGSQVQGPQQAAEGKIDFAAIERKWQGEWESSKAFETKDDSKKKKCYVLEMFPYPSSSGLHMGHAFNYTIGDIFARFKRMNNFNVLYPMGYDAFGLPAENAAIKAGSHPGIFTEKSMANFIKQQKELGLSYDWSRLVRTCDPEYYKWNQYFFLKFLEKGLAYRKKAAVNWCPKCETVLANEQVHSGKCWRHEDTEVEIKHLEQWFIKTTKYSEELLANLPKLNWPESIKSMQENWIGKSHGIEIDFEINGEKWPIFTTRPDTIFGVTFMVVSAQHPRLNELVTKGQRAAVDSFLKKIKSTSEKDAIELEKEGAFTGACAINPLTKEKVPVWTGNFVVADYGAGMVMAVPAHDQRDYEFAVKYKIPVKQVIAPLFLADKKVDECKPNKKTVERESVFAIVKHWEEEKYFCLTWKPELGWKSLILGGVEKGETPKDAAIREAKEESGYQDIKSVKPLLFELQSKYYARHKDVNCFAKQKCFVVELGSDKYSPPEEEHVKNHKGSWVPKSEVANFLNINACSFCWNSYINGEKSFTEEGLLINSGSFDGIESAKAIEEISKHLESKKFGRRVVNYKFRDWLISRQRYWGTPIPVVYCDKCGIVPVPEKELPIKLPEKVTFGQGNPLLSSKEFVNTTCPKCKGPAKRETDTMDTFFDSSWYFLRYCDSKNSKEPFDKNKVKYWMPVDQYIGGAEHACMHLIYARFFTMALRDMKLLDLKSGEPFTNLFNQGKMHGPDGFVMSKSRGNVVLPAEVSNRFGIDTARLFLTSQSLPDKDTQWKEDGIEGTYKVVVKIMNFFGKVKTGSSSRRIESKIHKAIKGVSEDIENFRYNFAAIKLRELFDALEDEKEVSKEHLSIFLKLLHPFCPHITEELWHKLGNKNLISLESWPVADEKKIDENLERIEGAVDTLRLDILKVKGLAKIEQVSKVRIFVAPKWKWAALKIVQGACKEKPDFGAAMKALMSNSEMKRHAAEVPVFLKTALARMNEIGELQEFDEVAVLKEAAPSLSKEFGKIEIIPAETSQEQKAKNAFPAKPALLIE